MIKQRAQLQLGASMYVPATQHIDRLVSIANGEKFPQLRSVIFCTEDAVRGEELHTALRNLKHALPRFAVNNRLLRFIRVRNPDVMARCIATPGIENIDGFVMPKITRSNIGAYLSLLTDKDDFCLMPTIETREVFESGEMLRLRRVLLNDSRAVGRILCLRIGGNDLMSCLGLRRSFEHTIYETALGPFIARLAGEFLPYDIGLSAPVFEITCPQARPVLERELELDLLHGLFGKTAIHPSQIDVIEASYKVRREDFEEALKIVEPDAPAVFKLGRRMCEPTTHMSWAQLIIARAEIYGIRS
ncbi:MAG: HpcH/HpaI aldolase/citrate lyase family protein [Candidatus Obscuribacter sp.]|nr:HpcH/HpaI aldolase/citrate lyase family protein [Candidatus Obscuribacter sp.]